MAAAFDRLEVLLRLLDLVLPNRSGRPRLSRGQFLGWRERGAVATAFAGRQLDTRSSIRIAAFRETCERRTAKTCARVGQRPLVVRLALVLTRFPRAAERHGRNHERRAGDTRPLQRR
jgi:hypothetical protein